MSNSTTYAELPPLPRYSLRPLPSLLPLVPDKILTILLPVVAYWILSLFFHYIDTRDYWPQYRLHTPAEVLKRNRVPRRDVVRDVLVQQVLQTVMGVVLGMTEPDDVVGKEVYDVAVWAQRIRLVQRLIPRILSVVGIDSLALAESIAESYPISAGALSGGHYPSLQQHVWVASGEDAVVSSFAGWEIMAAHLIYSVLIPVLQFALAIFVLDTWQYFLHRAMHMNQWLYRECSLLRLIPEAHLAVKGTFHARHHRLYVPYAYGALYNHPFEGFLLDTLGATVAFKAAAMTTRQGMCFFTCSSIKTVDDHCGYALPWDPLQHLTSNNAGYHDVHHQSWGIKTNFSQPFFTFWDRILGTVWTGGDVSARYERSRNAAQKQVDLDDLRAVSITQSDPVDSLRQSEHPYEKEVANAQILTLQSEAEALPKIPQGKATVQAIGSRDQVLQDRVSGGQSVLANEAEEEQEAKKAVKRSVRKPTRSSTPQAGSLKNLRERVSSSAHGRSGGVLGMESSR
ncbi:MAG: hypothetical protein M1833_005504 [Piccolia ochrophora]|nr:MAG: hypothetical protein M1833_005504 [Piccolia ochrophora]